MPRCTRKGCGQDFDLATNDPSSCTYHSGAPVFHEGLKSWSCCSDVNKPALDFDEFMKVPGCTVSSHTDKAPEVPAPAIKTSSIASNLIVKEAKDGAEVYSTSTPKLAPPKPSIPPPVEAPVVEDEDDLDVPVSPGTVCKRRSCGTAFVSDEVNRIGDGDETVCTYHPAVPIFHEGSKGYICCKRRVLEFDEFLKIEGCKKGRHVFAPKQRTELQVEQFTDCRVDHYQTPKEVHISVFAKQVDKEKSTVAIEDNQIHLDLYLPGPKRFRRTIVLFGPVNPDGSSYKFYNTKVEVVLKKLDTRSWTLLEKTTRDLGNISLTFGVGGRTGTIGSKDLVLDEQNTNRVN
ncbi:chord-domain-containing protein [Suillus discolor]|uniref:Chord-domain-containing protein n=1 Tax=Suillus discolor TaxID=1912936 RepID=A0A9P7FG41_9AGAM|nr:chord-domain-containing protein [Suillus discolor]KAG2115122.1 chord-domain-containing protein [Suillus discolor]